MKAVITIITLLLFAGTGWTMEMPEKGEAPIIKGKCPETQVVGEVDDCLKCHVAGNFKVKETKPDATRDYPTRHMTVLQDEKGEYGYYLLEDILPDPVKEYLEYLEQHNIKRAVVEIYSPGGSLFGAWRIIGLMNVAKSKGLNIETRCHGFAASAGFLIFISGSTGERAISSQATIMWHELMSFAMLKISTPSSSEDEARILRQLQDTANSYIASRCKLTKDELDARVKRKEFWMNGDEAMRDGFADKLLTAK